MLYAFIHNVTIHIMVEPAYNLLPVFKALSGVRMCLLALREWFVAYFPLSLALIEGFPNES